MSARGTHTAAHFAPETWITLEAAESKYHISRRSLYRLIHDGQILSTKRKGTRRLVMAESVMAYLHGGIEAAGLIDLGKERERRRLKRPCASADLEAAARRFGL